MAQYSIGVPSALIGTNAAQPLFEIQTSATTYARILEVTGYVQNTNSNTFVVGLGRPAAAGVGADRPYSFVPYVPGTPDPGVSIFTQWTRPPTVPARFFRRASCSNVSSNGVPFQFRMGNGILMLPSTSMLIWIITTNATINVPETVEMFVEIDA